MSKELIAILQKAYNDGFITSIIQQEIDQVKKTLKISDAEYQNIDNNVRIATYLKKVKERSEKGNTFIGDLRKQYKITDDDKDIIESQKAVAAKLAEKPPQPKNAVGATPAPVQAQSKRVDDSTPAVPVKPKESTVVKPVNPVMEPNTAGTAQPSASTGPIVLVADDNQIHLTLTKKLLEKNNYTCITAESPEAAMQLIIEKKPAIILCDINFGIGKQSGLDMFYEMKSKKIKIPFIILSAYFQKEFTEYARQIGVSDYLTKPFDPNTLLAAIKKNIRAT